MVDHVWHDAPKGPYLLLQGFTDALVRKEPLPDKGYLWQFRKVYGFCDTLREAIDHVEAGAEFFSVFRRNPWG